MSLKVVFHPEARKEYLAQIEYYNRAYLALDRGLSRRSMKRLKESFITQIATP